MKKIVVKIGADMDDDLEKLGHPENVDNFPDHTIYFKSIKQLASVLSNQKLTLLQYVSRSVGCP